VTGRDITYIALEDEKMRNAGFPGDKEVANMF